MDNVYLNMIRDIVTNALGDILHEALVIIAVMVIKRIKKAKKITVCPSRPVISDNVLFQMSIPFGLIELAFEALSVPALNRD